MGLLKNITLKIRKKDDEFPHHSLDGGYLDWIQFISELYQQEKTTSGALIEHHPRITLVQRHQQETTASITLIMHHLTQIGRQKRIFSIQRKSYVKIIVVRIALHTRTE